MFVAARNIAKSWLLVLALAALFGLIGWALGGARLASIFVFCELPLGEAPLLHSTAERLAAHAGIVKPRLYLIPDGLPIAAATGRGIRSSALAVSTGCVSACTPAEL